MKQTIEPELTSKARLLAHASAHVKTHGFAASPVDALAKQAGMTSGAVYQHFAGKADLFATMMDAELQKTSQRFSHIAAHDAAAAEKALNKYINQAHVEHPEAGCALPSLTAEVARASQAVKLAYQNGLMDIHQHLSRITGSPQTAWTLLAQSVGSIMLARAMSDSALQSDLLSAVKAQSLSLLNGGLPTSAA